MKVGDTLYYPRKDVIRDGMKRTVVYKIGEVTITKLGRKYCYAVKDLGRSMGCPLKIEMSSLHELSPYGVEKRLFATKEECEDYIWMDEHARAVCNLVSCVRSPKLLKKVAELVGYEE